MKDKIKRALYHPVTAVAGAAGTLGSLFPIPVLDALMQTIWAQAGTVFAGVSLTASQGWLPDGTGQVAILVAGALFLGRILDQLLDGFEERIEEDDD